MQHQRTIAELAASALMAIPVAASVAITVDRVDPTDDISQPAAGIVCVDVLMDVSPDDVWTVGGFRGETLHGAQFVYARDPNDPATIWIVNPGTAQRFTTFVSRPRPRDGNARFENGAVQPVNRVCSQPPFPVVQPTIFDLNYFATPPVTQGSPSVDGAVLRVAVDVGSICRGQLAEVHRIGEAPPGWVAILVSECVGPWGPGGGTYAETYDGTTPTALNWGVYVPDLMACQVDINCSGRVSLPDLALLLSSFGECSGSPVFLPRADLDHSGCVGLSDLAALLNSFDSDCP